MEPSPASTTKSAPEPLMKKMLALFHDTKYFSSIIQTSSRSNFRLKSGCGIDPSSEKNLLVWTDVRCNEGNDLVKFLSDEKAIFVTGSRSIERNKNNKIFIAPSCFKIREIKKLAINLRFELLPIRIEKKFWHQGAQLAIKTDKTADPSLPCLHWLSSASGIVWKVSRNTFHLHLWK